MSKDFIQNHNHVRMYIYLYKYSWIGGSVVSLEHLITDHKCNGTTSDGHSCQQEEFLSSVHSWPLQRETCYWAHCRKEHYLKLFHTDFITSQGGVHTLITSESCVGRNWYCATNRNTGVYPENSILQIRKIWFKAYLIGSAMYGVLNPSGSS